MSVDIGGYWGGWEGGVVVESSWGSEPLGQGTSYGGGQEGSISSDLGFNSERETFGLGYDERHGADDRHGERIPCVQDGVPPKCPAGQTAEWDQSSCRWVCKQVPVPDFFCVQGGVPPECPAGQTVEWDQFSCRWVCKTQTGNGGGGEGGKTPLDRVADVIERVLAGGGGGIIIPQIPQPQAVVAPATERRYNPAAIVLLVAGLALGGYYVYQRTRRS